MNENKTETKKDKFTLKVTKHKEFPKLTVGDITTTSTLANDILDLFYDVYDDIIGAQVVVNNQFLDVKLYFGEAVERNGRRAFSLLGKEPIGDKPSIIKTLSALEQRYSKNIYTITDSGFEGLQDFILRPDQVKGASSLNPFIKEVVENGSMGQRVLVEVSGLNVFKLLAEIYGNKDEDGGYVQYQVTPIRPVGQINPNTPNAAIDWLVSMVRLDINSLNKVGRKIGMIQNNGIPMVTR